MAKPNADRKKFWVAVQSENNLLGFYLLDYPSPEHVAVTRIGYLSEPMAQSWVFPVVLYSRGNGAVEAVIDSHDKGIEFWREIEHFREAVCQS